MGRFSSWLSNRIRSAPLRSWRRRSSYITGKIEGGAKTSRKQRLRFIIERRRSEVEFDETSRKQHRTTTVGATETTCDVARRVFTHLQNVAYTRCVRKLFEILYYSSAELFCSPFSSVTATRGHAYKLYKSSCVNSTRSRYFAERIVNVWNFLPSSVNFSTLNVFKRSL